METQLPIPPKWARWRVRVGNIVYCHDAVKEIAEASAKDAARRLGAPAIVERVNKRQ